MPAFVMELGRQTAHGSGMGAVWFSPVLLPGVEETHGSPLGVSPSLWGGCRDFPCSHHLLVGLLELVLATQVGNPGIVLPVFNSETGTALQGVVRAGTGSPDPQVGD